jgi:hypothetical protein
MNGREGQERKAYAVSCFNKPTTQCKKCTNYYCSEHFPSHLDLLPDGDFEYTSSNEGLEPYID